jgi:hypothetical protein
MQEQFEDIKWILRIRKQNDRQHNNQKKRIKGQTIHKTLHIKLKIERRERH